MYVPHYSVALATGQYARRAPLWALLTGTFLPDIVWIVLARAGVEPADSVHFFDDWSHSLFSTIVFATIFSCLFWRRGRCAVIGLWLVVFSHFVLDFPVHPRHIAAYPMGRLHLGSDSWITWGSRNGWLGWSNDWWLQFFVLLFFLGIYIIAAHRNLPWKVVATSCVALIGLQLITLAPCVGY